MRIFVLLIMLITGCTSATKYGECVGLLDTKDPNLYYETKTSNVVLAVVFSETVVVPLFVVLKQYQCPIGNKP